MKNNQIWVWGYVLETVPGPMMFVNGQTACSLETAADYLGADNVIYMDSCTNRANLDDRKKMAMFTGKALEVVNIADKSADEQEGAYKALLSRWKEEYRRNQI